MNLHTLAPPARTTPPRHSAQQRLTAAEYLALTESKPNKLHAKPVIVDDQRFDSKLEAGRYGELMWQESQGLIRDLKRQVRYPLLANGQPILLESKHGRRQQAVYVADHVFFDCYEERTVIEDAKGHDTRLSALKRAILKTMLGPNYEIRLFRAAKPPRRARRAKSRRR